MDILEAFKNRIYTLKNEALSHDILLPFYNLEQQDIIKHCFKKTDEVKAYFYGGYQNSEYKRVIISPYVIKEEDFLISTIEITPNLKTDKLNHRAILGSILALGLKREVIGDIISLDDKYYFFTTTQMKDFILDNLRQIGRTFVALKEYTGPLNYEVKFKEETIFVASMRLDNIVSSSFNISRNKAKDLILGSLVKINHQEVTSTDKQVRPDSLLSVRSKGRVYVGDILGKTKSGNLILNIKKPL